MLLVILYEKLTAFPLQSAAPTTATTTETTFAATSWTGWKACTLQKIVEGSRNKDTGQKDVFVCQYLSTYVYYLPHLDHLFEVSGVPQLRVLDAARLLLLPEGRHCLLRPLQALGEGRRHRAEEVHAQVRPILAVAAVAQLKFCRRLSQRR